MSDAPETPKRGTVRWHQTLSFRVTVLCGVLLACLLASVLVLTRYYINEAADEMKQQAERMANTITLRFEENPDQDVRQFADDMALTFGDEVEYRPFVESDTARMPIDTPAEEVASTVYVESGPDGRLTRVAHLIVPLGDHPTLLTLRVPIDPQIEIVRAFTNRYIAVLTAIFILTCGLMIYTIRRSLQPLAALSESCAAIPEGALDPVRAPGATGEILALQETFNGMGRSLKEKEMVEARLRQAQRLSALGNLAAGVAHDIRNPLNAIKLLSSHAADQLGDGPAARPMQTIRHEVSRLEEIVSSFLSLARESELNPAPEALDPILEDCVHLFKQDAEARGVKLSADLRAGDLRLLLDEKQWKRAILNVLLNALEACPPGGRVRVFSRVTERDCEIEVRDDGPGLDRETAERVFEPYFTSKPGGTGLGLSITRGIIEEHGGRIEITGIEGQGCQVVISMPLKTTQAL